MKPVYRESSPGVFEPWSGEAINGVYHPLNVAEIWSPEDLASIGLFVPAPADSPPPGMRASEVRVERVDGIVKLVPVLSAIPIEQLRTEAKERARVFADDVGGRFTSKYPRHEIDSFSTKFRQAREVKSGATSAPLLETEAGVLGITVAELADKIILKGEVFEAAAGLIAAYRQKTETAIDAAQSAAEIEAILSAARTEAEAAYDTLVA